jgi:hypothetical protein
MRIIVLLVLLAIAPGTARADYDWGKWDYNLDYELDSRTGRYRPAYTHKSSRGDSTIWLDRDAGGKKSKTKTDPLLVEVTWPTGWKVEKQAKTATARAADGSTFTIFATRAGRAKNEDFLAEWRRRAQTQFGALAETDIQRYDAGVVALAAVRPSRGRVLALCIVYDDGRALPIVLDFPDVDAAQKHLPAMEAFFGSIKLVRGKLATQ